MESVITQSAELLQTIWAIMGNALNRHYAGGGCLPTPTHAIKPIKPTGFDQLDCPGLFGTLLDRYPELDPRGDEVAAAAEPLPGPSTDQSYDGNNGTKLDMDSHLLRKKCFHKTEEKLDRGITTLIMNLATLVTNMDDLKDLADSMHLPRRTATLLVTVI